MARRRRRGGRRGGRRVVQAAFIGPMDAPAGYVKKRSYWKLGNYTKSKLQERRQKACKSLYGKYKYYKYRYEKKGCGS